MQKAWYPGRRQGRGARNASQTQRWSQGAGGRLPLKPGRGGPCGRRLAESPWHCTQPAVARLGSPRPHTRSRKAAAQCRPSTDSPRCDPGRAGVRLWRTLRTRGRRPRALTDEFAANRRLPATERIVPRGRRGDGAGPLGTKPGVAVGWMEAGVRLARRGSPCDVLTAQGGQQWPSPALRSARRHEMVPKGLGGPQDCLLSAQTRALGYSPQARLRPPLPTSTLVPGGVSGLQTLAFF